MLMFGIIGYAFKKLDYPMAPPVLALVLGDMAESNFRNAMILSDGDLSIFWSNELVGGICALSLLMMFWPAISNGPKVLRSTMRSQPAESPSGVKGRGRGAGAGSGDGRRVV